MTRPLLTSPRWDDETRERLRLHVAEGLTSSEISRRMSDHYGVSYSRNAIMGQIHRLKLKLHGAVIGADGERIRRPITPRSVKVAPPKPAKAPPPEEPAPRGDVEDGCRWLHGDAVERVFCGAPVHRAAWCAHHYSRAYVPEAPASARRLVQSSIYFARRA